MNSENKKQMSYHTMAILALIVGIIGIALQFLPGFELLSFMLTGSVLGGLIGGNDSYEEPDRQQLGRSYKKAFEWLLLAVLMAYAVIVLSSWSLMIGAAAAFLNAHWPGLILSVMCIAMGIAGLQKGGTTAPA